MNWEVALRLIRNVLMAACIVTCGISSSQALACAAPGQCSFTVKSGETHRAMYGSTMGKDASGNGPRVPAPINLSVKAKHGTVTIRKTENRTEVFYQSKKNYVGEDSFQLVRATNDRWGGTYQFAVTVR